MYNNSGTTEFGNNFVVNKNCSISCDSKITFGKDVLIGWNVIIRDSDGHKIIKDGELKKDKDEINVGNHVWICSYVDVLKGTKIGENSVIAYRACLTGKSFQKNSLIAGFPAKIIQENINWEK